MSRLQFLCPRHSKLVRQGYYSIALKPMHWYDICIVRCCNEKILGEKNADVSN